MCLESCIFRISSLLYDYCQRKRAGGCGAIHTNYKIDKAYKRVEVIQRKTKTDTGLQSLIIQRYNLSLNN